LNTDVVRLHTALLGAPEYRIGRRRGHLPLASGDVCAFPVRCRLAAANQLTARVVG